MSESWTSVTGKKKPNKPRCVAINCNKAARKECFVGHFCQMHFVQIKDIRTKVTNARHNRDMALELQFRLKEQQIRGVDIGHAYRILVLQEKLKRLPIKRPAFEY